MNSLLKIMKSVDIGDTDQEDTAYRAGKLNREKHQGKSIRKELRFWKVGRNVTTEKVIYLPILMLSENILDNR